PELQRLSREGPVGLPFPPRKNAPSRMEFSITIFSEGLGVVTRCTGRPMQLRLMTQPNPSSFVRPSTPAWCAALASLLLLAATGCGADQSDAGEDPGNDTGGTTGSGGGNGSATGGTSASRGTTAGTGGGPGAVTGFDQTIEGGGTQSGFFP